MSDSRAVPVNWSPVRDNTVDRLIPGGADCALPSACHTHLDGPEQASSAVVVGAHDALDGTPARTSCRLHTRVRIVVAILPVGAGWVSAITAALANPVLYR